MRRLTTSPTPPRLGVASRWQPLWFALVVSVLSAGTADAQLRVIVNRAVPDGGVSMSELSRLFRGEYGSLANGQRVVLAEELAARAKYVRVVTGMTDDQFRRHWIRLVFAGTPVQPPRTFPDAATTCTFVARTPGALAIVDGRCGADVRTLSVDGREADDPLYPLRWPG